MIAFHWSRPPSSLSPSSIPHFPLVSGPFPCAPLPSDLKGKLSLFAQIGMSIPTPLTQVCRSLPFILVKWLVLVVISPPFGGAFIPPHEHRVPPGKECNQAAALRSFTSSSLEMRHRVFKVSLCCWFRIIPTSSSISSVFSRTTTFGRVAILILRKTLTACQHTFHPILNHPWESFIILFHKSLL